MVHQLPSLRHLEALDFDTLNRLLGQRCAADKGKLLVVEGGLATRVSILLQGWAMRYKSLADGRRQVLNFLLPGDTVGIFGMLTRNAEYGVETLTPVILHSLRADRLLAAIRDPRRLAVVVNWLTGHDERRLDEQILRIGRRGATERMAHLFMELYYRLLKIGISEAEARCFPLTQNILADTLGMSHVHANRSFRTLVREQLVALYDGEIRVLDPEGLAVQAGFNPGYLEQRPLAPAVQQALTG
jgi:CRP-like cAMP-binding protein